MALTAIQKNFIKRQEAQQTANLVQEGKLNLVDLQEMATSDATFRTRFAEIKAILDNAPKPEELADFEALCQAVEARPDSGDTLEHINRYLAKWGGEKSAAAHAAQADEMCSKLFERQAFRTVRDHANEAIRRHAEGHGLPKSTVAQEINNFISQYERYPFASEDISVIRELGQTIQSIRGAALEEGWNELFDSEGKLKDFNALVTYLNTMAAPLETWERADDKAWEWALEQSDILGSIESYRSVFGHASRHTGEMARILGLGEQWKKCSGSIPYIHQFLQMYPNSPFENAARARITELKDGELEQLRKNPIQYSVEYFKQLLKLGFDKAELMDAAGMDEEMYKTNIENYDTLKATLPAPPTRESKFGTGLGEEGLTDIVFFGITSSGKTCVLSGLLRHESLFSDKQRYSGDYAHVLESYANAGFTVSGTPRDFVATIKAKVNDPESKVEYNFNLFEMAGEDFTAKIAGARDNNNQYIVSFEDMGSGAADILKTGNDKVFFLIIDPTAEPQRQLQQQRAMQAMVALMFGDTKGNNPNEDIMQRVKGLHFIVTKSDTLEGEPREAARNMVKDIFKQALVNEIVAGCRKYGINASNDSKVDGHPRVFPFSLGRFTVDNMFKYNPKGSGDIIQVICDYCSGRRKESFGYTILNFFSKSLI